MKTAPLATETLVQLLVAAQVSPDTRERARDAHRADEPVTLRQQPDFTFKLEFASGASLHLSYQEGNTLLGSLKKS